MTATPDASLLRPYLDLKMTLIPLHRWNEKGKDKKGNTIAKGKRPVDKKWTTNVYDARKSAKAMEETGINVGVRLTSEILVIDVDYRNMPEDELGFRKDVFEEFCKATRLDWHQFPTVRTGSGGLHIYMSKSPDTVTVDGLAGYPGVEFKSRGRQVVSAGSVHPETGGLYHWEESTPALNEEETLPPAPDQVLTLIKRPAPKAAAGADGGELTQIELADCLSGLDPEDFKDEADWRKLMMACHHATAGDGRQEFIDWSIQDTDYADSAWEIGVRWDSLHRPQSRETMVTVHTLYHIMRDKGAHELIPRISARDDFANADIGFENAELKYSPAQGPTDIYPVEELGPEYEELGPLTQMNRKYYAVDENGKFRIYYEQRDPSSGFMEWISSSRQDFEAILMNRRIEKTVTKPDGSQETKTVPLSQEWLTWAKRRTVNGIVFAPGEHHPGFLNLWAGWGVDPAPGDWGLLKQLIHEVLCDGDNEGYEYVMRWMAYMVQKPNLAPGVAIAFHGDKGTGKSTLGRALSRLCGKHGRHIVSSEHFTGRFNSHLMDTLFLFADEAVQPSDKSALSRIKGLITEPRLQFEAKGKDLMAGKNRLHVMMASNDDWFVPASAADGERRYYISRVSNSRRGDKKFFKALNRQLNNGGYEAMLHDLLLYPLGNWVPSDSIPKTKAMVEQQTRNLPPVGAWWMNKLDAGDLGFPTTDSEKYDWTNGEVRAFFQDVKEDYQAFCKENQIRPGGSNKTMDRYFKSELRRFCPGMPDKEIRDRVPDPGETGRFIKPAGSTDRARAFQFPSLEQCRRDFEKLLQVEAGSVYGKDASPEDRPKISIEGQEEEDFLK